MDRLLQHPTADALRVVTPAGSAEPVGFAEQFDQHVLRGTDDAALDDPLDLAPLRREAEFVADGKLHAPFAGAFHHVPAVLDFQCHRLLQ